MTYHLGIDIGTTYTAAAVHRDAQVEICSLGNRAPTIPSVIFLKSDDTILTGDPANRRALSEPERVAREFKRRMGDPTPIMLGGTPYSAEVLTAKLLEWVVDHVSTREGSGPDGITVTHPANWGDYKLDLLQQAVRHADLDAVRLLTEPEAAAVFYAAQERVEPGAIVAVYDLGGGTFDSSVLRKIPLGFEFLGPPEGIERLGGIDFDVAVFAHVTETLGSAWADIDPENPATVAAVARLRSDCTEAKEALSVDTDVAIPVVLPGVQREVRLTRPEFEDKIRPALAETIVALRRALRSAGVTPEEVSAVLLVGGSSRVPLISQMLSAEIGRPVAVDAHPKHAVALGAAIAGAGVPGDLDEGSVERLHAPHAVAGNGHRAPEVERPTPPQVPVVDLANPPAEVTSEMSPAGAGAQPRAPVPPVPSPPVDAPATAAVAAVVDPTMVQPATSTSPWSKPEMPAYVTSGSPVRRRRRLPRWLVVILFGLIPLAVGFVPTYFIIRALNENQGQPVHITDDLTEDKTYSPHPVLLLGGEGSLTH